MSYQGGPGRGIHPPNHHPQAPHSPKGQQPPPHLQQGHGAPAPSSRIMELLDALKHEVEAIHEEASFSKHHRKDLEQKLVAQISEVSAFQKSLYDLDRMHHAIKSAYEEDIKRLRQELESRGIPIPPATNLAAVAHPSMQQMRKPSLGHEDINKRLKDANSNPVPSPRYGEHRTSVAANSKPPGVPPPAFQNQYRQGGPPPAAAGNGNPPQYSPAQQQQRSITPPGPIPAQQAPAAPQKEEVTLLVNPKIQKANLRVDQVHSFDHNSVVCCVKFSPDGNYLATGCNHFTQIFEISSGRKILALIDESVPKTDDLYIRSVCFSPDGVYLATGAEDRVIRIWDIVNGRIKLKLVGHRQDIYSLDWTTYGRYIVSGSGDHTVKIWDPETGACIRTLQNGSPDANAGKDAGITCVAIQPTEGKGIAAASLDEVICIWDLRTGFLLERFEGHENSVYSVAFSPNGNSIISGSLDQTLRIWDLSQQTLAILSSPPSDRRPEAVVTKKPRHVFQGHRDYVLSVGYPGSHSTIGRVDPHGHAIHDPSFDIDWVISGSKDRLVLFWDAKDVGSSESQALLTMTGHKNSVISIAVGPSGGLLATGSGDLKARIWRVSRTPSIVPVPAQEAAAVPVQQKTLQTAAAQQQPVAAPQQQPAPVKAPSPNLGQIPSPQLSKPHTLAPVLSLPVVKPVSAGPQSVSPQIPKQGGGSPEKLAASPPLGSPQLAAKQLEAASPKSAKLPSPSRDEDEAMDE